MGLLEPEPLDLPLEPGPRLSAEVVEGALTRLVFREPGPHGGEHRHSGPGGEHQLFTDFRSPGTRPGQVGGEAIP